MIKKLSVTLCTLILGGCAMKPKVTYVPVVLPCPYPSLPAKYNDPVNDLKTGDLPAMVAKAYVISRKLCLAQNAVIRKKIEVLKNETKDVP